jgi:hypothetical protein
LIHIVFPFAAPGFGVAAIMRSRLSMTVGAQFEQRGMSLAARRQFGVLSQSLDHAVH